MAPPRSRPPGADPAYDAAGPRLAGPKSGHTQQVLLERLQDAVDQATPAQRAAAMAVLAKLGGADTASAASRSGPEGLSAGDGPAFEAEPTATDPASAPGSSSNTDTSQRGQLVLMQLLSGACTLEAATLIDLAKALQIRVDWLGGETLPAGHALTRAQAGLSLAYGTADPDQRRTLLAELDALIKRHGGKLVVLVGLVFTAGVLTATLTGTASIDSPPRDGAIVMEASADPSDQDASGVDDTIIAASIERLVDEGRTHVRFGRMDSARTQFETAWELAQARLDARPRDPEAAEWAGYAKFYLADLAYREGDLDTAEPLYREYDALTRRYLELAPQDRNAQRERGFAAQNLGVVDYRRGRVDQAQARFANAYDQLAAAGAGPATLADVRAWQADTLMAAGELRRAVETRRAQRALLDQQSPGQARLVATARAAEAEMRALMALGEIEAGDELARTLLGPLETEVEMRRAQGEGTRALERRYIALVHWQARFALAEGRVNTAQLLTAHASDWQAALETAEGLTQPLDVAAQLQLESRVALAQQAYDQAERSATSALRILETQTGPDIHAAGLRGQLFELIGLAQTGRDDPLEARRSFASGLAALGTSPSASALDDAVRARLAARLGEEDVVIAARTRLAGIGYADPFDLAFWDTRAQARLTPQATGDENE